MGQYQHGGSGGKHQQAAPKPFGHLPLPDEVTRSSPIGHHCYHNNYISGQIIGTIVALSPIHIGSGIIDLAENVRIIDENVALIKTAVRRGDKIMIPGSSLKGAIRSVAEAITESCVCKVDTKRVHLPQRYKECDRKNNLCVACRMFGAMGFSRKCRDTGCQTH